MVIFALMVGVNIMVRKMAPRKKTFTKIMMTIAMIVIVVGVCVVDWRVLW